MAKNKILTLDLKFQGQRQSIASYCIPHSNGVVLIESGPGSTLPRLISALSEHGYSLRDVTHVFLTHIHLDHAGASGRLAQEETEIIVHPLGAPHLLNPEKLLASAGRIYGDQMEKLWGEVLPVPNDRVRCPDDGEEIVVGNLRLIPVRTSGHAEHHYSYLFEDVCFTGDIGGIRVPEFKYVRAPMVPPELHLERWHKSIESLRALKFKYIAPTHFGIYDDPVWHLMELERGLDEAALWLEKIMPGNPSIEEMRAMFVAWMDAQGSEIGLTNEGAKSFGLANPLGMSADGLFRYWNKVRNTHPN